MIVKALLGKSKDEVLSGGGGLGPLAPRIQAIASGAYREKKKDAIRGSGYVVECLEAALWCFLETDNFRGAVLKRSISEMTRIRRERSAGKSPGRFSGSLLFLWSGDGAW